MKKQLIAILCLLSLLFACVPTAQAVERNEDGSYDVQRDGVNYRVYDAEGYTAVVAGTQEAMTPTVYVAEEIDGVPVTLIDTDAFANDVVQEVFLPDSILEIRIYAFHNCSNLRRVRMSNQLETICGHAFLGCDSLRMLYLPPTLKNYEQLYEFRSLNPYYLTILYHSLPIDVVDWMNDITIQLEMGKEYICTYDAVYLIENGEAALFYAGFPSPALEVTTYVLPDKVEGYPVTRILPNCCLGRGRWLILVLGKYVKRIEEGVFDLFDFPAATYVPPSVTYIGDKPYHSLNEPPVIYGVTGSYAERYAAECGIPFVDLSKIPFTDVSEDAWYYEDVRNAYYDGLMSGTSEMTFEPNGTMTRAMVVKVLANMSGVENFSWRYGFTDVPSREWYSEAVNWARYYGIAYGTTALTFSPNQPVTREQFAAFLFRYAQVCNVDSGARGELGGFADARTVSDYAKEAMQWAVGSGIIFGTDKNKLNPQGYATRAEAAAMLCRFLQSLGA